MWPGTIVPVALADSSTRAGRSRLPPKRNACFTSVSTNGSSLVNSPRNKSSAAANSSATGAYSRFQSRATSSGCLIACSMR